MCVFLISVQCTSCLAHKTAPLQKTKCLKSLIWDRFCCTPHNDGSWEMGSWPWIVTKGFGAYLVLCLLLNSPGFSFKGINHLQIQIAIIYSCSFSIQWPFLMTKYQSVPLKSLQRYSNMAQILHRNVWLRDTWETMTFDVNDFQHSTIICPQNSELFGELCTTIAFSCKWDCVFLCLYRVNQCRRLTVRQRRIVRVHQGFIPRRPAVMPNEDDVMKKTSSRLTT